MDSRHADSFQHDLARAVAVGFDFSPRAIADAKAEIEQALRPFDAVQTLAAIVAFSSFSAAETYSEPTTAPSTRMEYIAMVLLERDDPSGLRVMTAGQTSRAASAIQQALDHSQLIGGQTMFRLFSLRDKSSDPLDAIAAHIQVRDTMLRGPGYEHQAKAFVGAAFADEVVEEALLEKLGFGARDALLLEASAASIVQRRHDAAVDLCRAISLHAEEFAFQMHRRAEHTLCLTADDLARDAGVSVDTADSFLRHFAIAFGEARGTHLLTDVDLLRVRPFIDAGDGRFLVTSAVNLLWAVPTALEEALKDRPEWENYQARRSDVVEGMTAASLAEVVRADACWVNIEFEVDGGARHEIDGMVLVDDVLFVFEAKGGRLSRRARRGRKRELRPALEELVGKSSSQADRLARAIRNGEDVAFFDKGDRVRVDLSRVERVEPIIVMLEDLSGLRRHQEELVALELQSADEPPPWIVSAFSLEIICQTLEFPAQLTLYLDARRRLTARVIGSDEMDLWMIHLLSKLEFPTDANALVWGDWTEDLDRFFMFGHGEVPRMPLSNRVRKQVETIDRKRSPGHVRETELLIEADQATRLPKPRSSPTTPELLADMTFGPARRRLQA